MYFLSPNLEICIRFICILHQNIIFSDSASYFLKNEYAYYFGRYPDSIKNGVAGITFPGMGSI